MDEPKVMHLVRFWNIVISWVEFSFIARSLVAGIDPEIAALAGKYNVIQVPSLIPTTIYMVPSLVYHFRNLSYS